MIKPAQQSYVSQIWQGLIELDDIPDIGKRITVCQVVDSSIMLCAQKIAYKKTGEERRLEEEKVFNGLVKPAIHIKIRIQDLSRAMFYSRRKQKNG